jgi:hypothetical protein
MGCGPVRRGAAHEDHAVRACYAALRMQESVKCYGQGVFRSHGVPIQIRVGLNSGDVVVRAIRSDLHMDYTAVGQTTHLAARMEQLAAPGTILLGPMTMQLAEGYVQAPTKGPVTVKGLSDPVEVFELIGASAVSSRLQAAALGRTRRRPAATLEDVSDAALERISADGFNWVWLLGGWQTGGAGRQVSRSRPEWRQEYADVLPDFTTDDICGSPFAVSDYVANGDFGGPFEVQKFRKRLGDRGVKLMLDFVPNHAALDHPWSRLHPEFYVEGSVDDLVREPHNYCRGETGSGPRARPMGAIPIFPGWPDTLQLKYRHRKLRRAMLEVLDTIAGQCDGLRFDMAMLVLPEVVIRTWGDRGRDADGSPFADESFWSRRALLVPGLRFVHEGQPAGRRVRPPTPVSPRSRARGRRTGVVLPAPVRLHGADRNTPRRLRLVDPAPAWDGNPTWERFIAFAWEAPERRLLVAVNYGPTQAQCYLRPPWADAGARGGPAGPDDGRHPVRARGGDLSRRGLYLDMRPGVTTCSRSEREVEPPRAPPHRRRPDRDAEAVKGCPR